MRQHLVSLEVSGGLGLFAIMREDCSEYSRAMPCGSCEHRNYLISNRYDNNLKSVSLSRCLPISRLQYNRGILLHRSTVLLAHC